MPAFHNIFAFVKDEHGHGHRVPVGWWVVVRDRMKGRETTGKKNDQNVPITPPTPDPRVTDIIGSVSKAPC